MKRSALYAFVTAALVPAASLWAGPTIVNSPNQFVNQIAYQTSHIQADADGIQGYVRSGAHDWMSTYTYANDMANSLRKLGSLVNEVSSQSSATSQSRQQGDKLKVEVAMLRAIIADTVKDLSPNAVSLHAGAVFAETTNIADRSNMIRDAAMSLVGAQ